MNTFDELCKIKDKLDKEAINIGQKARTLENIDIHNLSKEKRQWIFESIQSIKTSQKNLSEICGQIEFLKTWFAPRLKDIEAAKIKEDEKDDGYCITCGKYFFNNHNCMDF